MAPTKGMNQQKRTGKKRKDFHTNITEAMYQWAAREAARDGVSIAFVIANAISFASGIPSGNEVLRPYLVKGRKNA